MSPHIALICVVALSFGFAVAAVLGRAPRLERSRVSLFLLAFALAAAWLFGRHGEWSFFAWLVWSACGHAGFGVGLLLRR